MNDSTEIRWNWTCAHRADRRRLAEASAYAAASRGEHVLILAPDAASAWESWTAFIKDHVDHQNDDHNRVTVFPGGGSVRVSDGLHEAPSDQLTDDRRTVAVLDDAMCAGTISVEEREKYGADIDRRLTEAIRLPRRGASDV
jgi:hypothetical protein